MIRRLAHKLDLVLDILYAWFAFVEHKLKLTVPWNDAYNNGGR